MGFDRGTRFSTGSVVAPYIQYVIPQCAGFPFILRPLFNAYPFSHSFFPCLLIVYLLTNKGTHDKCDALQESFSHKQIISRYIAGADIASVTPPGRQVWPVPCLPEVQLALPTTPAKTLSPGNRLRGHLSFWINGHTCTPTCPQCCHTAARREGEKKE